MYDKLCYKSKGRKLRKFMLGKVRSVDIGGPFCCLNCKANYTRTSFHVLPIIVRAKTCWTWQKLHVLVSTTSQLHSSTPKMVQDWIVDWSTAPDFMVPGI